MAQQQMQSLQILACTVRGHLGRPEAKIVDTSMPECLLACMLLLQVCFCVAISQAMWLIGRSNTRSAHGSSHAAQALQNVVEVKGDCSGCLQNGD